MANVVAKLPPPAAPDVERDDLAYLQRPCSRPPISSRNSGTPERVPIAFNFRGSFVAQFASRKMGPPNARRGEVAKMVGNGKVDLQF